MTTTTFIDNSAPAVNAAWLNDVNDLTYDHVTYLPLTCVGDGATNDYTALQAALTAGAGGIIDGLGLTYKCNSVLTGITSNTVLQNMTLDFSDVVGASATYLSAVGSVGSTVALTSNLTAASVTVAVGNTATFAAEQWVWLESTAVWLGSPLVIIEIGEATGKEAAPIIGGSCNIKP